ncbi:MAG TPA: ribosomal-processing cysteine protease Prp [Mobilitalea sp.]|nr:ribosomal-processing cysteine protease Prp [Mobilitalea sp.]
MIKATIYKDSEGMITGFKVMGHAGYAKAGKDIICSAVTTLVINTINSIEHFTSDKFQYEQEEKKGLIEFHVISPISNNTTLLLNSLTLGLQGIRDEYTDKYIHITQVKSL